MPPSFAATAAALALAALSLAALSARAAPLDAPLHAPHVAVYRYVEQRVRAAACPHPFTCEALLFVERGDDTSLARVHAGYLIYSAVSAATLPIDPLVSAAAAALSPRAALTIARQIVGALRAQYADIMCDVSDGEVAGAIERMASVAATCADTDDARCFSFDEVRRCVVS